MRRRIACAVLPLLACLWSVLPEKHLRNWLEVNTPNFRIVSSTEAEEAREMAYRFEQARAVFNATIADPRSVDGRPVTVIVARDEGFAQKVWQGKLKTTSDEQVLHSALGGHRYYLFLRQPSMMNMAYMSRMGNRFPFLSASGSFRAYARIFVPQNFGALPLWLETGLQGLYGHPHYGPGGFEFGGRALDEMRFTSSTSPPMDTLLALDILALASGSTPSARAFEDKSAALVHYMLYSLETAKPDSLAKVIEHIQNGGDVFDAVREFVGDPANLQKQLIKHLRRDSKAAFSVPAPPGVPLREIPVRRLAPAEVAAVLGDFYLLAGRRDAAREQLSAALLLAPESAEALESFAWLEHMDGNDKKALALIQQALTVNPESYLGHFYSGAIQAEAAKTENELARAESELRRAIALNPGYAPSYHALAKALLNGGKSLDKAIQQMQEAVFRDPGVSSYYLTTARISLKAGRSDIFVPSAKLALLSARTSEDHQAAKSLVDSLPKPRAVAQPAPPATITQNSLPEGEPYKPQLRRRPKQAQPAIDAGSTPAPIRKESGRIESVTCKAFAMDLLLVGTGFTRRLHTDNLVQVIYLQDRNRAERFDPCKKLVAQQARVTYIQRGGKDSDGEFSMIEFVK